MLPHMTYVFQESPGWQALRDRDEDAAGRAAEAFGKHYGGWFPCWLHDLKIIHTYPSFAMDKTIHSGVSGSQHSV